MLDGTGQRLKGRLVGHADLAACTRHLPAWLPLPAAVRADLPRLWTRLLGQPGFNADLIEDVTRPEGERILALGMAIALDPFWQARLRDDPPACAAAALYEALRAGDFAPPDDKTLAAMNAKGEVSFFVLHYAQAQTDLDEADTLELLSVAMHLFRGAHAGYRLRELYQEGVGQEGEYLQSMGFRLRTPARDPSAIRLYGLTRDEAVRLLPGSPVRDAFQFTPPLIGFAGAERRLLRLAVTDLTDERIGDELGLSIHTIRKLWKDINARALQRLPQLFEESEGTVEGTRGPEKRRVLLHYLRQHPEELRPYASPSGARRGAPGVV